MKFGYAIVYVENMEKALAFYENGLGLTKKFVHEAGQYAEFDTGGTTLSLCEHGLAAQNLPDGFIPLDGVSEPVGLELGFITDDVAAGVERAVAAGAKLLSGPAQKPWGQTVAFLRGPHGELFEIATAVGG